MACDVRIAALLGLVRPAGDQPRDHPGLRRHPAAAAARRPGEGARDEHDRRADLGRGGVRVRPRQPASCRTTSCSTPRSPWARKFAQQAPLALEQIKRVSHQGDLDDGHRRREGGVRDGVRAPRTRARASARSSRSARRSSRGSERGRGRAGRADPLGQLGRRAHRRRDLGAVRDPRLPLARAPGCGRTSTRWRSRTSTSCGATRSASGTSTASASRRCDGKQPNGAHRALAELERRGLLAAVITQNIDGLHARGRARAT